MHVHKHSGIETARTKRFQIRLSSINHSLLLLLFYSCGDFFFCSLRFVPFFGARMRMCWLLLVLLSFAYEQKIMVALFFPMPTHLIRMEIATLQDGKKGFTHSHTHTHTRSDDWKVLVLFGQASIEREQRKPGETMFLLFIGLTIRTIHNSCIWIKCLLKLHHKRIAAAVLRSPFIFFTINNFRIRLASFSIYFVWLAHSIVH